MVDNPEIPDISDIDERRDEFGNPSDFIVPVGDLIGNVEFKPRSAETDLESA